MDDELLTLREACEVIFRGRLSPSALRTEAAKGNLIITQIARKDFVTPRALKDMIVRCSSSPAATSRPRITAIETPRENLGITAQEALRIRLQQRLRSPS